MKVFLYDFFFKLPNSLAPLIMKLFIVYSKNLLVVVTCSGGAFLRGRDDGEKREDGEIQSNLGPPSPSSSSFLLASFSSCLNFSIIDLFVKPATGEAAIEAKSM